jgi:Na+-transporting NADH:ubiquinone oxidoreductase subunit C
VADTSDSGGFDGARGGFDKEGIGNVLTVAIVMCLVCSIIVAGAAVNLRPAQQLNKELDKKQNILRAAGMLPAKATVDAEGRGVEELFGQFSVRAVDLASGRFVADFDVDDYNERRAARDPASSRDLSNAEDIATLGRLENVALIYIMENDAGIERVVLPVRGYGLWGTLYGFLALEGDLRTISGLAFYDQKETPGLGGEVDNPRWKAQWVGVQLFDDAGEPAVRLVKTRSASGSEAAAYEVDALSGATLTTRGVENLVRFWAGDLGFRPFLENLKAEAA